MSDYVVPHRWACLPDLTTPEMAAVLGEPPRWVTFILIAVVQIILVAMGCPILEVVAATTAGAAGAVQLGRRRRAVPASKRTT